ncbi:MAG TPA: DUF1573 domain-containing protein [Saprospiraceae bacterium]|nr:DUF1573 domain-containing protein [Saprospiraceae bacterium]
MKHLITLSIVFLSFWANSGVNAQTLKAVDNSQNAGKVEWLDRQITTGNVPFGTPVTREFRFKNISSENLLILQVKSSCHCTVAEWDRNPVEPGKTGVIKISYDAQKDGDFYRIVSVITNFDSMQSIPLALVGKVDKKPEASSGN